MLLFTIKSIMYVYNCLLQERSCSFDMVVKYTIIFVLIRMTYLYLQYILCLLFVWFNEPIPLELLSLLTRSSKLFIRFIKSGLNIYSFGNEKILFILYSVYMFEFSDWMLRFLVVWPNNSYLEGHFLVNFLSRATPICKFLAKS